MKDNFSTRADRYAQFRPTYPRALFDLLFSLSPGKGSAWDCGTGNGQVARQLARVFHTVQATDISRQQLDNAVVLPHIHYSVQSAEATDFPDHSFDLITVAQAIHWFDFAAFYAEAHRTLKPGGILAVIGYNLPRFNSAVDAVVDRFYRDVIGPYWDKERRYIDENYRTIPFPYADLPSPAFTIDVQWSFDHLMGYIETWSAVKHFQKQKGENPVALVEPRLKAAWGEAERLSGHFPILLRLARVG
jgi:ubiquinone/menaquinone biosynthesis C-methylase UbiE